MKKKKMRFVERVYAHLHLDEIFAYLVLCKFGRDCFDGTEIAKVITDGTVLGKNPSEWAAAKAVCLGGGGDLFDEHRSGKHARLENESASSLTMKYLKVEDPHMHRLAEEVNRWDNTRTEDRRQRKTHLASILKMHKVQRPGHDSIAWKWAAEMVEAVYADLSNPGLSGPKVSFETYMERLLERTKSGFTDAEALEGLKMTLGLKKKKTPDPDKTPENANTSEDLLGIKNIYEALWRTDRSATAAIKRTVVLDHMMALLEVLYRDQVNFHEFRRQVEALDTGLGNETWFRITIVDGEGRGESVRAAIVRTDNPQAHNALRSLGAIITIVMNVAGNVTVQGNQDWLKKKENEWLKGPLDRGISDLCAMYRHSDMAAKRCAELTWEDLSMRGEFPGDPRCWTLAKEGWLSIYNGTHNHAAAPTSLSLEQLRLWAQHAFCPSFLDEWRLENLPAKPLKAAARTKRKGANHDSAVRADSRRVEKGVRELFEEPLSPEARN